MSDTESIDLNSAALLDEDTIPNANQSIDCFSCGESISGVYCYACGNKNDNYRRSIWSLGGELFASLTAFEGRIWRSLRSLIFNPGRMAREFSNGARQKWTSPIRMYLATSLLLFGYIALSQTQLVAFGTNMNSSSTVIKVGAGSQGLRPQVFFLERKSTIQKTVSEDAIKAFEENMADIITDDGDKSKEQLERELKGLKAALERYDAQIENANKYAKVGMTQGRIPMAEHIKRLESQIENYDMESIDIESTDKDQPAETADETADETSDDTNIKFSDVTGETFKLDSKGLRQAMSIGLRQPERINAPIGEWLPKIMFLMMPFSMLLGAIFIRGREKAMLYDHLVHSAYIHAFSFLLLFVFMLLVQFTPIPGLLLIYTLILLIYLPLSAKRMFGRGWFKSILTSYGVGAIYTFIMMIVLTVLIVMGLSDIMKDVATATPS